jgi:membrane protein
MDGHACWGATVLLLRVPYEAYRRFLADDGWAIGGYIALTTLMSLFPFLIVVTEVAGLLGSKEIADQVAQILLEAWPKEVATPIASEIGDVLTSVRGSSALTIGALFSIYFSSSCVESLRVGLNRSYGVQEARNGIILRLESIGYVLIGVISMIALAFLVVLGPLIFSAALKYFPWLAPLEATLTFARLGVASIVLIVALVMIHKWLPAGRRTFVDILPGIITTLILWLVTGVAFGRYLAEFSGSYTRTYAGLSSVMIALVFLYWTASIFVFGGELNSAIMKARTKQPEETKP